MHGLLAASTDYTASLISLNVPSRLSPNQVGQVQVAFKNIGLATWYQGGANYASIYRWDSRRKIELASVFYSPSWEAKERAARLPLASVPPGKEVTFTFPIKAPNLPGTYREEFTLTAENAAWVKYGTFTVSIQVGEGSSTAAVNPVVPAVSTIPSADTSNAPSLPVGSSEWQGQLAEREGTEWQIERGDLVPVVIGFKNTGTKTWKREGAGYVSLYATQNANKERNSAFYDTRWISRSHVVILREAEVAPGQIGHFRFDVRAPQTPGTFQEEFTLAAENTAWIKGATFPMFIRVPLTGSFIATGLPGYDLTTTPAPPAAPMNPGYVTSLMLRSVQTLVAAGDSRQQVTFGFKNVGTNPWTTRSLRMKEVTPVLAGSNSSIRDASWNDAVEAIRLVGAVKPGEIGFMSFTLKAPSLRGDYKATFQLIADDQTVSGGEIEIPISVTADGAVPYRPVNPTPSTSVPSNPSTPIINAPPVEAIPLTGDPSSLSAEPIIRVGLYAPTDDRMTVRAMTSALTVLQNGSSICRLNTGESTTISYDRTNRVYKIEGGPCMSQSTQWYIVRAEDGISPIEISSYARNDDSFRAQVELRFTPQTNRVWVINELPVEWYLKGIAETSNVSPQQFQRVLLVAARTYAMYHVGRGTKHADEFYTVDATYDQVYRGYGAEARDPNVVAAVDATRGQIVTYQGRLAITPYYSRSDGRTRSWGEVWGGGSQYPWLVSVPVPWDNGQTLLGHGVGMSARGALMMANEGKLYDYILGYFYPGTELRRAYR